MRPLRVLIPVALLTAGCALFTKPADEIRFGRGEFVTTWHEVDKTFALTMASAEANCGFKTELVTELEAATSQMDRVQVARIDTLLRRLRNDQACAALPRIQDQWRGVADRVEASIRNPELAIDWDAVRQALELIAKLAGAAL